MTSGINTVARRNTLLLTTRTRLQIALLTCAFIIVMMWNYGNLIVISHEYLGIFYTDPGRVLTAVSWILALLPILWLPLRTTRASRYIYCVIYVSTYVPACVLVPVSTERPPTEILYLLFGLAASYFLLGLIYRIPLMSIPRIPLSSRGFTVLLYVITIGGCVLIGSKFGFSFHLHAFDAVYESRFAMRDALRGNRLYGYLLPWECNVLVPLLFVHSLVYRRWHMAALAVFLELFLYSVTAMKGVLFAIPMVFVVVLLIAYGRRSLAWYIVAGSAVAVISFTALDLALGSTDFSTYFVRRQFVTPGLMFGVWYDFFADNPKLMLSHSIFRAFIDYPYSINPGFLIGYERFGSAELNACVNYMGDGYANFGMAGIVGASLILGTYSFVFDCLSRNVDIHMATGALVIPGLALADGAVLTCILTHGLAMAMLMILVIPKSGSVNRT